MSYQKGGNLQGPAGTGKTETVKDLGKNLGKPVFVYNCSEKMDIKNFKTLLEGLVMTGFWGCFDELNRITVSVLSAISIYLGQTFDAIHA